MPELALPAPLPHSTSESVESVATAQQLIAEHFAFVWRLLRRLGLPASDADDAAQQVFLVACTKLELIQPGSERSFLYGCALNQLAKWRANRKRARNSIDLDSIAPEHASFQHSDAEQRIDQRRARELLDQLLEELPAELRTVFVLYELEQLNTFEIADMLQLPRGTVASRLRRAREEFEKRVTRAGRVHNQGNGL